MNKTIIKFLSIPAMALAMQSCLFQNPELTDDGQLGIDPTDVVVATDINMNLTMPSSEPESEAFIQPSTDGTSYKRRVIVTALAEGRSPVSKTLLLDIEPGLREVNVPVSLRLNARNYTLAVWSDYVSVADNGEINYTYFYNADLLPNVYMGTGYRGNNSFKDSSYAMAELPLAQYAKKMNARVNVDLQLQRPVGRLQLYASDTRAFLNKVASGEISGSSFAVRISYPGYLCMGYNIEQQTPRHSLMYMSYENSFTTKSMAEGEPFLLTFDYLFAATDANTAIPMQLEILSSDKSTVLASTSLTAYCRAGYCTTITYGFLNASNDQGITFDPDFDGSGSVVIVPIEK